MAKRCLESVVINGVTYPLATLSDFSFINTTEDNRTVYITSNTQSYIDEANTDFIPIIKPYSTAGTEYKKISNLYVSFANFPYTTVDGQRIAIRLVKGETDNYISSLGFGYNDTDLAIYLSIVVDDELQVGYIVISYYTNDPHSAYGTGYGMYVTGGDSDNGRDIYGIFKGIISPSGGAGSGYIGNSLLSNKKMVGYNVPTSEAESTKTESVNEASESPVSGKPKIGNGYARIRFLRSLEEKSIVAEMLARNQFKINGTGEAPTIYSGSMGTYDSATDSYYFSSNCGMDWKNWSALGVDLDKISRLTKIEFEWEGMVSNNSLGRGFDMQMQTYFNTNFMFINGIADGYDDSSSDKQKFARIKNGGSDRWETTEEVPFNNSSYQNAFHKVKWVWEIENSVAKDLSIYVDGNLFCHYSGTLYSFSITALGTNILRFATIDHTNVKYVKVAFYYMG